MFHTVFSRQSIYVYIYIYIFSFTSPAASTRPRAVCLCFCCTLGLYPMRSCLVVLVGTYGCLCGTLRGLVVSLWHFGWPWGSIVAPWVSILTHMGCSWESFGHFGETLGLHFGTLGLHLGTLGVHGGVLCALLGVALDPSCHFCGKCSKKAPQNDVKIKTNSMTV